MSHRAYLASCSSYAEAKRLRASLNPSNIGIVYEVTKKQEPVEGAAPYWHLEAVTQSKHLLAAVLPGLMNFVEGYRARERFEKQPVQVAGHEWVYRSYSITGGGPFEAGRFEYVHDDYDGAPLETGGPPADHRCGQAKTIRDAAEAIDELEDC